MPQMKLEIVTAEGVVYSDQVDVVVAPGVEGELGILPHHAPLLTLLQPGALRVVKDGQEQLLAVSGGFLEVLGNTVTVLADTAERAEEIDEERAQAAIRQAQEQLAAQPADQDLERALMAIRRAQARLTVARRRRPRAPGSSAPGSGGS
jgi:F-type H+-transporting ATPase subunit epsilon